MHMLCVRVCVYMGGYMHVCVHVWVCVRVRVWVYTCTYFVTMGKIWSWALHITLHHEQYLGYLVWVQLALVSIGNGALLCVCVCIHVCARVGVCTVVNVYSTFLHPCYLASFFTLLHPPHAFTSKTYMFVPSVLLSTSNFHSWSTGTQTVGCWHTSL